MPGAATVVIFHGRAYISGPADAQHPLVVDMDAAVMAQVIVEPPVALVWAFGMELFEFFRKPFILCCPLAQFTGSPFVVSRARCMEQLTGQFNGIARFLVCFPDCCIGAALSHFRKASLLSISSNFLADHAPFPPDTAYA